ncbi:hypothetical protein [Paraburkholderia terrae]|uniref:Uncharacterized protein n=1 Tax=Paraburkholderia terrae TaxID=311230 RepID=A0A2I8ETY9_9BURK|nr:hypothetical protein [Paraburkholderia terrae]AUT62862.1 hypothetical protein C2L65_25125 [Paraburkholderia terrae]
MREENYNERISVTSDALFKLIGQVFLYGGVSVGIGWLILQKSAERWVDAHFAKRQKQFEHEQAKELQRIKAKLDTVIQGSLKLQEREFKIIPEAWEKVSEAYSIASWLCSPLQSYTSLQRMSDAELEEFMSTRDHLSETQKQAIRDKRPEDRDKRWQEIDTDRRYFKARDALATADGFLKTNSIFLPDELREMFNEQTEVIWKALVAFEVGVQSEDYKMRNSAHETLRDEGKPLHERTEKAVRARLLEQTQLADDNTMMD